MTCSASIFKNVLPNGAFFFVLIFCLSFFGCENNPPKGEVAEKKITKDSLIVEKNEIYSLEKREEAILNLKKKIQKQEPIVVHTFVPLYGYDSIFSENYPVWADGTNLETNLYWGAGHGMKVYFSKFDNWKLVSAEKNAKDKVAERLIFTKKFGNGAEVYLIADAYRGYDMLPCLNDFFAAVSENNLDSIALEDKKIPANGNANLIVFNGHNGLMDYNLLLIPKKCKNPKETALIACYSGDYFNEHLQKYYAYPLLTTKGLIPAESYILASLIEPWVLLKTDNEIMQAIVSKFAKIHKKKKDEVEQLFKTGW